MNKILVRTDIIKYVLYSVLSPFILIINVFRDASRNKQTAVYGYALFVSFIAFLTAPASDLYRHYSLFETYHNMPWAKFVESISEDTLRGDFIIQFLMYTFNQLDFDYGFVRMLVQFIIFVIEGYIFNRCIRDNNNYNRLFCLFIVANSFMGFMGLRGPLAFSFAVLGIYLLYIEHRYIASALMFLLACATHFFFVTMSVVLILPFLVKLPKLSKKNFILFGSLALFIGATVVRTLSSNYGHFAEVYVDGVLGDDQVFTFKAIVLMYSQIIFIIPLLLVLLKHDGINQKFNSLITVLTMVSFATFSFNVIFSRAYPILTFLLFINYIYRYPIVSRGLKRICNISLVILFLMGLYTKRDYLDFDNNHYLCIYEPLPLMLTETFDDAWINQHLDGTWDALFRKTSH